MAGIRAILILALLLASVGAFADDQAAGAEPPLRVYGWQLMTEEELAAHRETMRSFETQAERQAYRAQHHAMMEQRAAERGATLIDERGGPKGPRGSGRSGARGDCCGGGPRGPCCKEGRGRSGCCDDPGCCESDASDDSSGER